MYRFSSIRVVSSNITNPSIRPGHDFELHCPRAATSIQTLGVAAVPTATNAGKGAYWPGLLTS